LRIIRSSQFYVNTFCTPKEQTISVWHY